MKQPKRVKIKRRDLNIVASYRGEVSMTTKVVDSRKKYSRKTKHKKSSYDMDI